MPRSRTRSQTQTRQPKTIALQDRQHSHAPIGSSLHRPLCLPKPRLAFPPQLCPVTGCSSRHGKEAQDWTTEQGLENHVEMHTTGDLEVVESSIHIWPVAQTCVFCSSQLDLRKENSFKSAAQQLFPTYLCDDAWAFRRNLCSPIRVALTSPRPVSLSLFWHRSILKNRWHARPSSHQAERESADTDGRTAMKSQERQWVGRERG